ncbi:DHA2 family efflux MFS transporter permease subunit [Nocardia inohanensis]|uniref:DHA2 family efflux MFS transporter permease subunit n=1 Tax=Nocardia inohanensis TaxID=209246 RepID=UPI00082C4951|nr:DHA2 family efflux MFS transporter permease subunit [Nocardia inohanensis]
MSTIMAPTSQSGVRARWAILAVILFAEILDLLDSTITTLAAPTIAADLGGGAALVQWLGAAYALAMGVLLVVGGRLGDKFGRRRLFLIGIAGFTIASVACGLAFDPASVITFRVLQGAFGALLIPQGFGILGAIFPRAELGKAFGVFAPALGLSAVCGPILAGFLIDANLFGLGWRPMFLINIVLGGLATALAVRLLPRDDGDRAVRVDTIGSILLAAAMLGLLYGLIDGPGTGWAPRSIMSLTAGLACFAVFCLRQRHAAAPLLEPSLLRNRGFTSGLLLGLLYFAATAGLMFVLSLYMQNVLHRNPTRTALSSAPLAVGIIVASIAGHQLLEKLGRTLVLIGLASTLTGTLTLLTLVAATDPTPTTLIAPIFLTGLGLGACFGSIYRVTLGDIDPVESGSASGSLSAVQQLANSIGAAAVTTVYFHTTGGATAALATVAVLTAACCALALLLPRTAAAAAH